MMLSSIASRESLKEKCMPHAAQHTPLPGVSTQATRPDNTGGFDCAITQPRSDNILAETFEHVGEINGDYIKFPAAENAAFIVKACNSYSELTQRNERFIRLLRRVQGKLINLASVKLGALGDELNQLQKL